MINFFRFSALIFGYNNWVKTYMKLINMENLVNHLLELEVLKTPRIIEAFRAIDRAFFVQEDLKDLAYIDDALPIGFEQTISQPFTVAFMLELLQPNFGEKILEIGYGSGWQTALLAYIVTNPRGLTAGVGRVYAMEVIKELCDFGAKNLNKFNFIEKGAVEVFCENAEKGLPEIAEKIEGFDKIISGAGIETEGVANEKNVIDFVPNEWKKQLKIGGRMVLPVGESIWLFVKKSEENFEVYEYPGFVFVPFVK